jgi:cardiolipin synthase
MGTSRVGRAGAGAIRIGSAVGAAITNHRVLGPAEAKIMLAVSLSIVVLTTVAVIWPRLIAIPAAFFGTWLAVSLGIRAYKLYVQRMKEINADEAERED